jgi:L-histidine Nalpha-methyltransferase
MNPSTQGPDSVPVLIHSSQFPAAVEGALIASLGAGRMNHGFHYNSAKQTRRWLRLHEAYSPARRDPSALGAYGTAMDRVVSELDGAARVDVLSLGCGGGQKDALLLRALGDLSAPPEIGYVPSDVSVGLTLTARAAALGAGVPGGRCRPLVLDLEAVGDWTEAYNEVLRGDARRVVLFLGMMPNFMPLGVLSRLAGLIGPDDLLLASANLAPGADYATGVREVLPLYENALTTEWLQTSLLDLGAERGDGRVEFRVAECPEGSGLLRIEADYVFERSCVLAAAGREWRFEPGDRFGLFYSYRHTPERVAALFSEVGLALSAQWTNAGGDEGVFLLRRAA